MELSYIQEVTFRARKRKNLKTLVKFQETNLSSPKLEKLPIFQEELPKPKKQTKRSAQKETKRHFSSLYSSKA